MTAPRKGSLRDWNGILTLGWADQIGWQATETAAIGHYPTGGELPLKIGETQMIPPQAMIPML